MDTALRMAEEVTLALGLRGLARIDCFVHADTGDVVVIEANTLPGLTPSTVLMHQAMAMEPPMYPPELFQVIVGSGIVSGESVGVLCEWGGLG